MYGLLRATCGATTRAIRLAAAVTTQRQHKKDSDHMLTGELRSQVDAIWNAFWSGGISNPMEVLEQIT